MEKNFEMEHKRFYQWTTGYLLDCELTMDEIKYIEERVMEAIMEKRGAEWISTQVH